MTWIHDDDKEWELMAENLDKLRQIEVCVLHLLEREDDYGIIFVIYMIIFVLI